ncbi:unnamed protein product [Colias eurytheme]|nr:unnamed protein product [Colias eurytheme]
MVAKKNVPSVLRFDPISERISVLRLKGKFSNITIINAYAPTELADEETKDSFYDDLESVYDQVPQYDVKIVLGDFNAKVGKEEVFVPAIGRHSKHDRSNDNGIRLISFATSKNMVIMSTVFPHKNIHKGTWKSPDGQTVNQIDHVLVDNRHKNSIKDVKTCRGADCDSDHYMLIIKVVAKINIANSDSKGTGHTIEIENTKDKELASKFQIELHNKFDSLEITEDVDATWESLSTIIRDVGMQILGKRKKRKKRKWWTDECTKSFEERRNLKVLAEQDSQWKESYEEARSKTRKVIRKAKRQHMDNIVTDMECLLQANLGKKFYQEIRSVKQDYKPTSQILADSNGNLVTDSPTLKTMWQQYFEGLLNCPPPEQRVETSIETIREVEVDPPTFKEVQDAIYKLKNHKAPGIDKIPAELWKYGDEFAVISGLKQGDALSPLLFNLALEYVIRKVLCLNGGVNLNGQHKVIGYADDLAMVGETKQQVTEAVACLKEEAAKIGLSINDTKTEYQHMRRYRNTRQKREDLTVGDSIFKGIGMYTNSLFGMESIGKLNKREQFSCSLESNA